MIYLIIFLFMPKHSLVLNNEIATLNESTEMKSSMGFIIRYETKKYIVSTHHFLPVIKTILNINSDIIELKKLKDIYWNEINIFESPDSKYLHNTPQIKNIKLRFLEPKTTIKIEIDNKFMKFPVVDYKAYCPNILSNLRNIYMRFYIGNKEDTIAANNFKGLSGSPVFSNENHLIGIFCKYQIENKHIYGWVLPIIYVIKSFTKNDNKNMYTLNCDFYENLKIGQYEIQKEENELFIYHLSANYKLPLDIFFYLEGDENKFIQLKNTLTNEMKSISFTKYDNFDITTNLEKREKTFKLNSGLFALLLNNHYQVEVQKIVHNYYKSDKVLNDIWISFNDSYQLKID